MAAAVRRKKKPVSEKPYSTKDISNKEKVTKVNNNKANNQDITMEVEPLNVEPSTTERLEEIDLSVIAQPSIKNIKKKTKLEKEKEILDEANTNNHLSKDESSKEKMNETKKLPSVQAEENKAKKITTEKHIAIMEGKKNYNISEDLNDKLANITITQLLDISPKLRSELIKLLKLKDSNSGEYPLNELVMTTISRDDIASTKCSVHGIEGTAFLDTCASLNLITRNFLSRIKEREDIHPMGYTNNNIVQIFSEKNLSSELYLLNVKFGDITIKDIFRVVDNDKNIFDILIGFNTLKDNKLFVHPIDNHLCKMLSEETWNRVSPLGTDDEELNAVYMKKTNDCSDKENIHTSYAFCLINKVIDKPDNDISNKIKEVKERPLKKQEIIEQLLDNIPKEFKYNVGKLFKEFDIILATKIDELQPTKLLPHTIPLVGDIKPIKQRGYRLSKVQAQALKQEITKLIENGLIEPSNSPWSSPVVLVLKKNKKWRMCVDYRKLNNVTIKDSYALPIIDEILFSMGRRVKIFTTIDLFSGFHQIPMNKEDIPKTTFTTMFGNYQFKVMPFGLCNAPGTFQREMNRIFFPLIGVCMFVYIDDLVIFSQSIEDHIQDLKKVFSIIKNNGLKVNLEKCHFFKQKVELLGHILSINGVAPIPEKIEIILNWLPPKNITQLQSFLGAVGYYRKFIFNFAKIAKPLYKLLKKGNEFKWETEQNDSFIELKDRLVKAPILIMPDFDKPFIIRTDASFDGLGGVLLQKGEDSREKPIHYISRSLKPPEKNYSITDLEGTAAFYCVKKFKSYISSNKCPTILYTDHKPLVSLFTSKEPNNARQTRWVLLLSMLKVEVLYEPGKKNVIADALSRMPSSKNEVIATVTVSVNNEMDGNILFNSLKDKFTIINGEKYYKDNGTLRKVIIEQKEKFDLIIKAHGVGHEGIFKTYNRLKRDYYWVNMIQDVKYIVRTCKKCQLFKPQSFNYQTEDIATKPGLPFTKVGLDIVGPLPTTKKGNQYIIVLVDYLTKWVEAEPTRNIESDDVISFLSKVFARHGIPEILITDNGPQFCSDKTKAFLDLYGVYVHFTTTYHPESNGEVENRNKEIGKYLRILCNRNTTIWDEMLPSALWALRTCKNETTKFSSFELLYGRRDLQPFELTLNLDKKEEYENEEEFLVRRFTKHYAWIKEAINNINTANKLWEDRRKQMKRMKAEYNPGDLVLVKLINRRKLDPFFLGPMKIVKKKFNTVTLCDPITNEIAERNVHLKNIVPYRLCEIETSRDEV